jgi:hypothetical protein
MFGSLFKSLNPFRKALGHDDGRLFIESLIGGAAGVNLENNTITLRGRGKVKSYPLDHVTSWAKRGDKWSGCALIVRVKDLDNLIWEIPATEKDVDRFCELLNQINSGSLTYQQT